MKKALFFTLSVLIGSVAAGSHILLLKEYTSGGSFTADGIENGAKLYVASNDDPAYLRNITLTSGSTTITLDKLSDYYDDGTPKYLNITGGLQIKTSNPDAVSNLLTGYIYVTTYDQARDTTFAVYVITGKQTISRDGMKTTTVVLNTNLQSTSVDIDKPVKTSYVTNIQQSSNTNLYFMWNVPDSNWYNVTTQTFFENPISTFLSREVTFLLDGEGIVSQTHGNPGVVQALLVSYFQAERLLVNSTSILPGTFYCQYFGYSTDLLPVTNAPSTASTTNTPIVTTTTRVATTTKFSHNSSILELLILAIAFVFVN